MSSNETNSPLEQISAALRATTKLTGETDKSEELTPEMLAGAIKLAALSAHHQEKLTPASVNAAIRVAKDSPEQQDSLTPESLAVALKLAMKVTKHADDHPQKKDAEEETGDASVDQMLTAMRAAITLTQKNQGNQLVTSELLSDALKLAKE